MCSLHLPRPLHASTLLERGSRHWVALHVSKDGVVPCSGSRCLIKEEKAGDAPDTPRQTRNFLDEDHDPPCHSTKDHDLPFRRRENGKLILFSKGGSQRLETRKQTCSEGFKRKLATLALQMCSLGAHASPPVYKPADDRESEARR
mmetsp:Transcript_201/g.610  ORF Transcript_201/g.610 Transcript_201/m.610 type:complete len:146 (-) Transcript_201:39-476(-)